MELQLYQHAKRLNSTKTPTSTPLTIQAYLKEECSLLAPVFELQPASATDNSLRSYNYAYVPAFARYYYVTDWIYDQGKQICTLAVDPLASWKQELLQNNLYIIRAESATDGDIIDSQYPATTEISVDHTDLTAIWAGNGTPSIDDGIFVLGIVSKSGDMGNLSYTAVTRQQLTQICGALLSDTLLTNDVDLNDAGFVLQQSIINPIQYIKSCTWLPIALADFWGTQETTLDVWRWSINVQNKKFVSAYNIPYDIDVPIRQHPQALRGQYLNHAPYTDITLVLQPFGAIPIDAGVISNHSMHIHIDLEIATGTAVLTISSAGYILNRLKSTVGVPIQLSQVLSDKLGAITSGIGAAASIGSGLLTGELVKGVAGAISGIGNALEASIPHVSSIGSSGSFADIRGVPSVNYHFYHVVDRMPAVYGNPYCKSAVLATLTGYVLASGSVSMPAGCTRTETESIQSAIDGGFYVE